MSDPIRIANCSGFYGDRFSAPLEMLEGGPVDVLTGDYLAELTMLILWKARQRDESLGYAATFYRQMEQVMGTCLERGVKVVSNAGGLNPASLARRLQDLAGELGVDAKIAHVEGDDVLARMKELHESGDPLLHLATGEPLVPGRGELVSANAYLGGFAIAAALDAGADVVVTGRVTDASLVVGPAAWHHGWKLHDYEQLAGAVVAGHAIECGPQVTGGNYSFFREVPGLEHPGFPIAEVHEDGSAVLTKHPGTGGEVSVGTVTAQLLYEIAGPLYENPDVTADFSTVRLEQQAPDRVKMSGTVGRPPPQRLKVSMNLLAGWRNTMTFVLTGLDIEQKAELVTRTLSEMLGGREGLAAFADHDVRLIRGDVADAATNEEASAQLRVSVKDPDREKVGRRFSNAAIELALASYPGFYLTSPPEDARAYGVYWPTLIARDEVDEVVVHHDGRRERVRREEGLPTRDAARVVPQALSAPPAPGASRLPGSFGPTRHLPLGTIVGARSGDKGPDANVGFWARSDAGFAWLRCALSVELLRSLLPEADGLAVDRYELPSIRAVNFVVRGLLGEGVASSTRPDPQAKSLGEYLRSRQVDIPESLLADAPGFPAEPAPRRATI